MGSSMKPGGGGRFKKLVKKVESEGKSPGAAAAVAAAAGDKKYGKKQMGDWATTGKKRGR